MGASVFMRVTPLLELKRERISRGLLCGRGEQASTHCGVVVGAALCGVAGDYADHLAKECHEDRAWCCGRYASLDEAGMSVGQRRNYSHSNDIGAGTTNAYNRL